MAPKKKKPAQPKRKAEPPPPPPPSLLPADVLREVVPLLDFADALASADVAVLSSAIHYDDQRGGGGGARPKEGVSWSRLHLHSLNHTLASLVAERSRRGAILR